MLNSRWGYYSAREMAERGKVGTFKYSPNYGGSTRNQSGGAALQERNSTRDVELSKALSWLLRHGAQREGIALEAGGWAYVDEILKHRRFAKRYTTDDVRRVALNDSKQRYALKEHEGTGRLQIRANQGHSVQVEDDGTLLTPLSSNDCPSVVVHGTTSAKWLNIRNEGLHRMARNHIHFAAGFPGEPGVISGFRPNCDIGIVIDANTAIFDGIRFFRSRNGVILTPGDEYGFVRPKYFKEVWNLREKRRIL